MAFSDEELTAIIKETRNDPNYFSKADSILRRCTFRHIDDTQFDAVAVDNLSGRVLHFSIIGRIVRKTTFLNPEGTYKPIGIGPTNRHELTAFLGTKLKASLAPPRDILNAEIARDDWARYRSTMAQLINATTGLSENGKFWSPYRDDKGVFILNHVLLSSKDDAAPSCSGKNEEKGKTNNTSKADNNVESSGELDNDPIEEVEEHTDMLFSIESDINKLGQIRNWPCDSDWHKVADRFDHSHYINPLPAFDDSYELILPQAYESKLLGAVVRARFTLSKFDIKSDYVFVCNIVELQVLKSPPVRAATRKRRALIDLVLHKKKKQRLLKLSPA